MIRRVTPTLRPHGRSPHHPRLYTSGSDEAAQHATGEFRGDTLISETRTRDGAAERERVVLPPGTMLMLSSSTVLLQQLVERARTLGGEHVELPVLLIGRDDDERDLIERVRISRIGADSMHVVLDADTQVRAAVDAQGRILGGTNPSANARIVRLR